jgi:hypothetical protein
VKWLKPWTKNKEITQLEGFQGGDTEGIKCPRCEILQEALDVERERFNLLLHRFVNPSEEELEETESEKKAPVSVTEIRSWDRQRSRLQQRSLTKAKDYYEVQSKMAQVTKSNLNG